jgi:hypothetical protein
MIIRKSLFAISLVGAFAAPFAVHAAAINFNVDIAPPAPVYEQMPAREGYVATPGYYRYDEASRAHTWVKGGYEPARKGEHYVGSEWKQQGGHYGRSEGHWEHDK